jgi:hypothetical protein
MVEAACPDRARDRIDAIEERIWLWLLKGGQVNRFLIGGHSGIDPSRSNGARNRIWGATYY